MKRVRVINSDAGNLFNVIRAFEYLGCHAELASQPEEVCTDDFLVLPGVGAFGDGMSNLRNRGMIDPVHEWVRMGKPFLGICLGMQLLFTSSKEFGEHEGLGIIPGQVTRLPDDAEMKIPNIGWHPLCPAEGASNKAWEGSILEGVTSKQDMYFVHSYAAYPEDQAHWLARTAFGSSWFCSAVRKDNVFGCQFHPEKSSEAGLNVLRMFLSQ